MTRRWGALAAAVVVVVGVGCTRVDQMLSAAPTPPPNTGAWSVLREQWTRKASIYDGLAMRALATATYAAPELRQERAERVAAWKAMTDAEREVLLGEERADGARFDDFLLSITTGDPADNDLTARDTDWRVALVVSGAPEILPVDIVELRVDALLRTLYPQIGDFDLVYRVRFARAGGVETWTQPFVLRLAGPRGRMDFTFQ